MHLVAIAVG
jgi:hypothetical protein